MRKHKKKKEENIIISNWRKRKNNKKVSNDSFWIWLKFYNEGEGVCVGLKGEWVKKGGERNLFSGDSFALHENENKKSFLHYDWRSRVLFSFFFFLFRLFVVVVFVSSTTTQKLVTRVFFKLFRFSYSRGYKIKKFFFLFT